MKNEKGIESFPGTGGLLQKVCEGFLDHCLPSNPDDKEQGAREA